MSADEKWTLAERQMVGQVLREIREALKPRPSLNAVGSRLGMTGANYQQYETGVRDFDETFVDGALEALGSDRAEFDRRRALIAGRGGSRRSLAEPRREFLFDVFGRVRAGPQGVEVYDVGEPLRQIDLRRLLGPQTDALEVAGDSMVPWAEPGEVVLFDRDRYPRRGMGCVIETIDGQYYVKLYEKTDGSTLFVKELFPEPRTIEFSLSKLRGIYAVRLRGD